MSDTTAPLPATMRGVYLPGNSTAEVRKLPVPVPGPGQVLLRVGAAGICGSDIGYIYRVHKSHRGVDGPAYRGVVAGHEPSGTVVSTGPGVRRYRTGDRVVVYHIAGCGLCDNCARGYQISCTDPSRAAYGWQRDGGAADYLLADEHTLVPLPDELSYVDGALIACGFGTAYEGIRRIGVNGDDDLLVVGLGPVGLAAAMTGRGRGARRVIGVEVSPERRAWADGLDVFDATVAPEEAADTVAVLTGGRGPRPRSTARAPAPAGPPPSGTSPNGDGSHWSARAGRWRPRSPTPSCTNRSRSTPPGSLRCRSWRSWHATLCAGASGRSASSVTASDSRGRTRRSGSPRALPGARSCSNPVWTLSGDRRERRGAGTPHTDCVRRADHAGQPAP